MISRFFEKIIVIFLFFSLVIPTTFFVAPQKARAVPEGTVMSGVGTTGGLGVDSGGGLTGGSDNNQSVGGEAAGCLGNIGAAAAAAATEFGLSTMAHPHGGSPAAAISAAGQCVTSAISLIKQAISTVSEAASAAAAYALVFDRYVLQPLAFVLSGKLLKALTAGVIAFAIGKANGTGIPQFVADIQVSLQTATDARTLAFLNEYMRSSRSPYAGSIVAALRRDYFNQTSLAGFWAANMDTLRRTSPNPYGYLGGNWALGGVEAWFALTTQDNNNPFMQYLNASQKLGSLIGPNPVPGIAGVKAADIRNGGGFASWCGERSETLGQMPSGAESAASENLTVVTASAYQDAYDEAHNSYLETHPVDNLNRTDSMEVYAEAARAGKAAGEAAESSARTGFTDSFQNNPQSTNPGDPCVTSDGTMGIVKTPGSVIAASLNKVLGGQQDNIVRMGNAGPEITNILANIATVMRTIDSAAKILGGPGSGGLFGVDSAPAGQTSLFRQQYGTEGNLGATTGTVYRGAAALPVSGSDMLARVAQYETAINSVRGVAATASTATISLRDFCIAQRNIASTTLAALPTPQAFANSLVNSGLTTDQIQTRIQSHTQYYENLGAFLVESTTQANTASTMLTTTIAPAFAQIETASTTIATARAFVRRIQDNLASNNTANTYTDDIQRLQTMSPTLRDVEEIQTATLRTQTAVATPPGSLNVSGGTGVDRLILIGTNAEALKAAKCTAPAAPTVSTTN